MQCYLPGYICLLENDIPNHDITNVVFPYEFSLVNVSTSVDNWGLVVYDCEQISR